MSDSSDLNVLVGNKETVTLVVDGSPVEITVPNIRIRQLTRVLELIEPVKELLMRSKPEGKPNQAQKVKSLDVTAFLTKHSETSIQLVHEILSPKNPVATLEWVGDLEIDQMILLTSKVFEVNLDFFTLRVVPSLSKALGDLNQGIRIRLLGGTVPLPNSSQQDTPAQS